MGALGLKHPWEKKTRVAQHSPATAVRQGHDQLFGDWLELLGEGRRAASSRWGASGEGMEGAGRDRARAGFWGKGRNGGKHPLGKIIISACGPQSHCQTAQIRESWHKLSQVSNQLAVSPQINRM